MSNKINPARAALVLMDLQPAVLEHVPDPDALMRAAHAAIRWARENSVVVVFVRVGFKPEDYAAIPHHHKSFAQAKRDQLLAADDPRMQLEPSLDVRADDHAVRKTRYGSFSTTHLHALLGDADVDTLVLGGVSTAGVVLSTVREAADKDYRMFVLADATADQDAEVHRVLIDKVMPRQAEVITVDDLEDLVRT
ncbi:MULTISPECIES: cysteine hydrolase family protein [unclassified Microbacterium]|uniref:cysteine hydrolase family protein n=1 Tax=unclassified Microbacterium TaxID=2609290 RepID=UPI003662B09D